MADLTPTLNELLKSHDARPTLDPSLTLRNIDEFLKEAYRIVSYAILASQLSTDAHLQNSHIASLNAYLKGIRQSYLSTAPPPRRTNASRDKQWNYLNDRQKEEIDAETKMLLRELNASIRNLAAAEQLRQDMETRLTRKKYDRLGLGALGSWAAGGAVQSKSVEQELDESKANAISMHRESVLWYLGQKLQECGSLQAAMMEKRLLREMEKNRNLLAKSQTVPVPELGGFDNAPVPPKKSKASSAAHQEAQELYPEQELTEEQIQIYEKENQDMLKHYESTLDQVRYVE
jgi:syntaxin 18